MSTLTVGSTGEFQTIAAAVAAASSGDTINVQAGTYTDDFLSIQKNLILQAVNGQVIMTEDQSPPDGKALITEGAPGISVAINGFEISGVTVPDSNGAAIRYEGGALSLSNDFFHNNQDGLLGAADPAGSISINDSEFASNGDGSGSTHNIYVGAINSFSITNSYVHDAVVGHEIKSRAASNTIENNRIFDNNGSASYSVDLPNGGNATISGNVIEQGPNTQNPFIIAYAEEGQANSGTSVSIASNTIINDDPRGAFALNPTNTALGFTNNQVWGLTAAKLPSGSGNIILASHPSLDTSSIAFMNPSSGVPQPPPDPTPTPNPIPPPPAPSPPPPPAALPLISIAAWQGEVLTDFVNYMSIHPNLWSDSNVLQTFVTEFSDPLTGSAGIPAAAAWGPFPS